jgi:CheY-like chemotaxis protein
MRILFIDDDSKSMVVYKDYFENLGFSVEIEVNLDRAFNHLSKIHNQILYDLIFVDHDFRKSNQLTKLKNGEELIEKLSLINCICPIVYLSSTMESNVTISKAFGEYGICYFYEKNFFNMNKLEYIDKIKSLENYKKNLTKRKELIKSELQEYFKQLSPSEYATWKVELDKNANSNWNDFEVLAFKKKYNIVELLNILTSDTSLKKVNEIISSFLELTKISQVFSSPLLVKAYKQCEIYIGFSEEDAKKVEDKISKIAESYFLNTLTILKDANRDEDTLYELSSKNSRNSKATPGFDVKNLSDDGKMNLFIVKLALRRVVSSIYYCNVRFNFKFQIEILGCLIREGRSLTLESEKNKKDIQSKDKVYVLLGDYKHSFSKIGLQLTILDKIVNDFPYDYSDPLSEYFLEQEKNWILNISPKLFRLRSCLDDMYYKILSNKNLKAFLSDDVFYDLEHFFEWRYKIKNELSQEEYDKIINLIKEVSLKFDDLQSFDICKIQC